MAMYYYASKLNEASCSTDFNMRVPPATTEAAPVPSPAAQQAPIVADPALLRDGNGLSYYDNDDYYSMVRGKKFMSESACKHIITNGGINFVASQKVDAPQIQAVIGPGALATLPYVNCEIERPDIEYRDGQIITGTLDALIEMLRPGATKLFKFTFILCSRLFMKPHELLGKLCKKYFNNCDKRTHGTMGVDFHRSELEDMMSLVALFSEWTIMFPYDFRDDRVMALVRVMSERCAAEHMSEVHIVMSTTLQKLLDKLTALEHYEKTLTVVPQMVSPDHLAQGDILTLGLTPVELASQLSTVELHKLSFVGPEEFVQTFAPHPARTASMISFALTPIEMHQIESKCTRNLEGYADWFNRLSYLVATDVLKSVKSKYRARVIEQWVMTARECFNLGNFNSLMAIISALNMSPITRLKKTWGRTSAVCGEQLRQLELCIEPSGNYARYRAALAAAPVETAVPLLSVTCRDLHFANQSAPIMLGGNRVNYEKCAAVAQHVSAHLSARRLTSEHPVEIDPPTPHHGVWCFLNDRPTLTETALEMSSFEREAPLDNLEKERFKRLRCSS